MHAIIDWMLSRKIFVARSAVLGTAVLLTLISRNFAASIFTFNLVGPVKLYHLLWAFVMTEMILVLIPSLDHFIGCGKLYKKYFMPKNHCKNALAEYTKTFDRRAIYSALVWFAALAGLGLLRLEKYWLVLASMFFYFLDQFFVNIWCPFQNWIVRNRCCATCRIYNWGFPIIVSPLIFIKSFWTYSLVAMGAVILVQWEILHRKYPERFSEISNAILSCKNCNDRCKSYAG